MNNHLTLGFSPCPNDTYMFYALVHNMVDTGALRFTPDIRDIEALNLAALAGELDVTKVSFHAYGLLRDTYRLLRSGAAMGRGCGPLVVSLRPTSMTELVGKKIAIPGRYTTAYLLLQLYDPALSRNVVEMPFHAILDTVRDGQADAGLIIHESRFTYADNGLTLVADLGQWWEQTYGLPIPLGCIVARRQSVDESLARRVSTAIRESILYANNHPQETLEYIRDYCRELSEGCIRGHIGLYVNDFSLDMGQEGERAVAVMLQLAQERGILKMNS
ncbi:MAG: 1,4-dihydroxy-6-naphthoate synthase [Nitrospirae bacterium]|uniref:1,4-dihydroxy-6-naphthoate synthase n=1 Tax=Candidatus Magnetobacterium casense TaxID=1455061 RepID=UPI00058AE101|nr:1,4-dihydroxy-6-naphthoate synthase [Candidatus Magnetobacterium casensis]MBF0337638.1 1,4-dihydroxy-6-naphthoate synthase [Nitrospirota bacterium]